MSTMGPDGGGCRRGRGGQQRGGWRSAVGRMGPLSLLLSLSAVGIPGCGNPYATNCSEGQSTWQCSIKSTPCHMTEVNFVCASDMQSAIAAANAKAVSTLKLKDQDIVGTTCTDTGSTRAPAQSVAPKRMPEDLPGCDADPADDACVSCAKTACCAAYQACSGDLNCSCLVGCLYQGNSVAACTSMDNCGAASAISVTTAACLDTSCAGACANPGGMGSAMCPPDTSSSSSGAGAGPSCTSGPTGSGEACFSDGDCASCTCNTQTMTCD